MPIASDSRINVPLSGAGTRKRAALALAIIAALAALTITAAGDDVIADDVRVARWVQAAPVPWGERLAAFGNLIGSVAGGAPLGATLTLVLIWRRLFPDAALIFLATTLRVVNGILKRTFDSPRPTPDLVRVTEQAESTGFPSGHAMGSTLLYGAVIVIVLRRLQPGWPRRAIVALCLGVILLTGYGRIYTGAHWPSDVAGGYLWGLTILTIAFSLVQLVAATRPIRWSTMTDHHRSARR